MNKITRKKLEQINDLVERAHGFVQQGNPIQACRHWLGAWQLVKQVKTRQMGDPEDFNYTYFHYLMHSIKDWTSELAWQLHNAGLEDPANHEFRILYVDDYFQYFPDTVEQDHIAVNFLRSKAEALWALGRKEEAEAEFASIIKKYRDNAWGYIGWSDLYWDNGSAEEEYAKGEKILFQALENKNLEDRIDVFDRLHRMYEEQGDAEKADAIEERMKNDPAPTHRKIRHPKYTDIPPIPDDLKYADYKYEDENQDENETIRKVERKPGRNEPCWCGSGKKYKKCHWRQDKS